MDNENPYNHLKVDFTHNNVNYTYYDINKLNDERILKLPVSIKVLL